MQIVIVTMVIVAAAGYLAVKLLRAARGGGACGKSCACPGQVANSTDRGSATPSRRQTIPTRRELIQLGVPDSLQSDQATGRAH